jgi:hypothetical protein
MDYRDILYLEFQLDDAVEASPSDFRYLFSAIDGVTQTLMVDEIRAFLESAGFSDREQDQIYSNLRGMSPLLPSPVNITAVRRESPWTVVAELSGIVLVWTLNKMIAPEILKAWGESRLKESFNRFLRDNLFRGAKQRVEANLSAKPQYGNLLVDDIIEPKTSRRSDPRIRIRFKRTEIVEVDTKDKELMKEFLKRMGLR